MNISVPEFLKTKYNNSTICHITGGGTNELYIVSNENMTRLVKIAGLNSDDIINEYNILQLLSEMSEVPKVYELFYIGERACIEIEFINGKNMLDTMLNLNDKSSMFSHFKKLGEELSKIHSIKLSNAYKVRNPAISDIDSFKVINYISPELLNRAISILQSIEPKDNELVLTHGDYGYHNVILAQSEELKVIDWEFAELNHPLNDISNVFFWTHLHFKENAEECCKQFINAYTEKSCIKINHDLLMPFCLYKVLFIMKRTLRLPDFVKKEWERRLNWIINIDFRI